MTDGAGPPSWVGYAGVAGAFLAPIGALVGWFARTVFSNVNERVAALEVRVQQLSTDLALSRERETAMSTSLARLERKLDKLADAHGELRVQLANEIKMALSRAAGLEDTNQ